MKKLDQSRPYAIISGIGEIHRFEQDGERFDGMGNCITEEGTVTGLDTSEYAEDEEIKLVVTDDAEEMPIATRLLIVDKNANGYLSVIEIKEALTKAGVEFNKKNNNRRSLLKALKDYMGVN